MGQKDFPPSARSDWGQNIGIGISLNPDALSQAGQEWGQLGEDVAQDLSDFYQAVAGGQHEWRGKGFDAFYGEAGRVQESARDHGKTAMDSYARKLADHSSDTAQAKSVVANNSTCEWGQDDGPAAEATANALQAMYRAPGESAFEEIPDFQPPTTVDGSGLGGGAPGGGASGGGSGGSSQSGGAPSGGTDRNPNINGGGDGEHTPRSYSGDGNQASSGDDKGASQGGSPSGGQGSGGGSPTGQGGGPDGGGPPPGGPSAATGPQGAPFDPSAYDPSSGGLPGGVDSSGAGGGFAGGVGGFSGGDRERSLSQKPGGAAARATEVRISTPKVPNLPSGMGSTPGGGVAPGVAGKKDDKERKIPSYLVNARHGQAMLGDALPVVNAPVMGELTEAEVQEMREAAKDQAPEKAKSGTAPPPPPSPGAPTARRNSGQP